MNQEIAEPDLLREIIIRKSKLKSAKYLISLNIQFTYILNLENCNQT
jgi:hypothetical protein